jgi:hypothetical protein
MDNTKKFLYVNPDVTAGEVDNSRLFPVSSLQGMAMTDATSLRLAFDEPGAGDICHVDITITSGKVKEVMEAIVNDINFSKESVIVLADASNKEKIHSFVDLGTNPVVTAAGNGSITLPSNTKITGNLTFNSGETQATTINDYDGIGVAFVVTDDVIILNTGTSSTSGRDEGFGYRKQVINIGSGNDDNALVLTTSDSGALVYVTPTNALSITLPLVGNNVGVFYDFIIAANFNKAFTIKTSGQDGNDNITLFSNASDAVAVDVGGTDHDVLTFTNAVAGSRIHLLCAAGGDAEKWHAYVSSMGTVDATIA